MSDSDSFVLYATPFAYLLTKLTEHILISKGIYYEIGKIRMLLNTMEIVSVILIGIVFLIVSIKCFQELKELKNKFSKRI